MKIANIPSLFLALAILGAAVVEGRVGSSSIVDVTRHGINDAADVVPNAIVGRNLKVCKRVSRVWLLFYFLVDYFTA
jgi:hypothetical protein